MSNIYNNNYQKIDCRLINDKYIDLMLSKDDIILNNNAKLATFINFKNIQGKHLVSEVAWENSVISDKILTNFGFTCVDNGFVNYERDKISNNEFLELFTNTKFDLSTFNDKFFVTEVNGNANIFKYPIEKYDDFISLKGGFYQGFFKIYGDSYQTLPNKINKEWIFNFSLRRKDYEISEKTLNNKYPDNNGIFFFIGTRAENKFWELYKKDDKMEDYKFNFENNELSEVIKQQYHVPVICDDIIDTCETDSYFSDEYLQNQSMIHDLNLNDTNEHPINQTGFYENETDNKFIIFNRTEDGFTTKTWKDDYNFVLTGQTIKHNINYFQYLNNTKNGYNKNNINKLIEENSIPYNVLKDIECNALCFKINNDGTIGYRYLANCCELIEENSKYSVINMDEWVDIKIKIKRKSNFLQNSYKQGSIKIYFYVNDYLKLVSKELPEVMLFPLNDCPEKQEGVPYNISIGGGSQGLSERILLNFYDNTQYLLPIEKYFAGTFIGDVKDFSFYYI